MKEGERERETNNLSSVSSSSSASTPSYYYPVFPVEGGVMGREAVELFKLFYSRGNPNGVLFSSPL
jgi:hypothetical protein